MKNKLIQATLRTPTSAGQVHERSRSAGYWRFLGVALCYGFLLLVGLAPGVASAGGEKVTLCHVPPGNPDNAQTITVAPSAVQAHLKNHPGDYQGSCVPVAVCPCVDNGDLLWSTANNASAMVASWGSNALFPPWSCQIDTTTLQGSFAGYIGGESGPTLLLMSPAVTAGSCIGTYGAIPVTPTQAQTCLQRMIDLGALLDPPVTCGSPLL